MTKGELIESVVIKVNGGRLTADTKVHRADVEVLLASAINYATIAQYRVNKNETGENDFPESFISTYPKVPIKTDSDRDLNYLELPTGILTIPKNYGLQSVSPMKGKNVFVQISFNEIPDVNYYVNSYKDITLYWLEGQRVYFQNLPAITDKVLVRLIQSIKDIEEDEELPVPSGLEIDILRIMDEWFSGQRKMPADYKPNNNGNTEQ